MWSQQTAVSPLGISKLISRSLHPPLRPTRPSSQPDSMLWSAGCSVLVLSAVLSGASAADMVFRCPGCTAERQALCPRLTESCAEIVREPGCGCCPVCARQEGHTCGVYTPRCATGLRCYPTPGAELPLEQLVQGMGQCRRRVEPEVTTLSSEPQHTSGEVAEVASEQGVSDGSVLQKPSKQAPWLGPKETAVRQHRQEQKTKMKTNKVEDTKVARPKQTQCQQELDQVLERISKMPFRDNRGPLEDLYALHIPNCDKRGHYNLKQCKMSLHGQRGECWCVNTHTGRPIPAAPIVRGDPNCSLYLTEQDVELPELDQM